MTVVRQLVTKLSFDVDKRGIENFNRAIIGFKTKFTLAATAASGFIGGIVKAASAVADTILDTDQLARSTGIATKELVGLQRAAGQFRISENQFQGALTRLNDQIRDAEFGFGQLFDLARQLEIEIRQDNGALKDTRTIFNSIIEALGRIDDEALRIDIAKRIFGDGGFADIAAEGVDSLNKIAESLEPLGEQFEQNRQNAERFSRSLNMLGQSAKELAFTVFPPVLEFLGEGFAGINELIRIGRSEGIGAAASALFEANKVRVTDALTGTTEAQRFIDSEVEAIRASRNVDIQTNVNVYPPPGTEEAMQTFMQVTAEQAFNESFDNRFNEILDNFPETE